MTFFLCIFNASMLRTDSNYFENLIQNDPGFILLKSHTASLVISFFYQEFIVYSKISVLEADLEEHLKTFLTDHKEELGNFDEENLDEPSNLFPDSKDKKQKYRLYVEKWCKKGFLSRYRNNDREVVLELTPSIVKLFNWLGNLKPKKFIGTESQFKSILDQLHDLYQHITEDTESRLKVLKQEKAELEAEITRLENGGKVDSYSPVQIFEMVDLCIKNGKDLINDFREVEVNFRNIGTEIYKRQSELNYSKGNILGFALDTDEKLRQSPQGQSFEAFWKFIAEDNDNEINTIANSIIEKVSSTSEISQIDSVDTDFLLNFKHLLFDAGSKIIDTKHGITDRLSRVLQQNQNGNFQKLNALINEIKKTASEKYKSKNYTSEKAFMLLDIKPFVARSPVPILPNTQKDFGKMEQSGDSNFNITDYNDLLTQFFVDRKQLIENINDYRKNHLIQFTLGQLLAEHPITKGMAEIAVYYDLLNSEKGLTVDENAKEQICYENDGTTIKVTVPKLIIQGNING